MMMSHSLRASSTLLVRVVRSSVPAAGRSFATSAAIRYPDVVQELYLKELRAYKPPAIKPADAEAHVQKFSMPKPPKSPEETSLSNEIQEYETAPVEVEGQASTGETQEPEGDYFEDLKVIDEEQRQPATH